MNRSRFLSSLLSSDINHRITLTLTREVVGICPGNPKGSTVIGFLMGGRLQICLLLVFQLLRAPEDPLLNFGQYSELTQEDILRMLLKQAGSLLNFAPHVWLLVHSRRVLLQFSPRSEHQQIIEIEDE